MTIGAVEPWDDLEHTHLESARHWIAGGAPLYRVRKPDVPPMHLVSYFAVPDDTRGQLLLVAHRKAGLWLPAGGHVEPGEDPWAAVVRECREEPGIEAVASPVAGERPFFPTITGTRGQGPHTDVSDARAGSRRVGRTARPPHAPLRSEAGVGAGGSGRVRIAASPARERRLFVGTCPPRVPEDGPP